MPMVDIWHRRIFPSPHDGHCWKDRELIVWIDGWMDGEWLSRCVSLPFIFASPKK
jgi:hypothetical protein